MIYFIQDQAKLYIKIGFTSKDDPDERKKMLQTGNGAPLMLLASIEGTREEEQELHKRFAGARECGEWFRPVPELVRHIVAEQAERAYELGNNACKINTRQAKKELRWPTSIYLAGKISQTDWRKDISEYCCRFHQDCPDKVNDYFGQEVPDLAGTFLDEDDYEFPVIKNAINGIHSYVGPYFIDCSMTKKGCKNCEGDGGDDCSCCRCNGDMDRHGACCSHPCNCIRGDGDCFFGDDSHGLAATGVFRLDHDCMPPVADKVHSLCLKAVERCDLLFAWIDSPDCFGTITEIGYASSLGKVIWIAGPKRFRDMWFVYKMADWVDFHPTNGAASALYMLLDRAEELIGKAVAQ